MNVDSNPKATVFAPAIRNNRSGVNASLRARVKDLRENVGDALGLFPEALLPVDRSREFSPEEVGTMARQCVDRARLVAELDEAAARDFYLLGLDLQQLALELHQDDLSQRNRRLGECADGLARLRGLRTSQDVVEAVCAETVVRCDFGRVVVSRVENGMWMPSMAHFTEDDPSWFTDWVEARIPLKGDTPETRLLTERRPAVVYDTGAATVHEDIIVESGQSSSYVVAPLMSAGNVVGFIHADHFPGTRRASEADRDVLWAFADGFSRIHERMVLMERVEAQRAQVGRLLDSTLRGMQREVPAVAAQVTINGHDVVLADLTARETEVLELMVDGATNRAIASQLVIAEDTVKSHVKQILRKLGVTNRAQAIARAAGTAA
ncbi:MAG TPA: LuxR C-terminal-related transcriptional regulator [Nocardioidaceae bacterium]|nr:LuxR C-terminal-related transcriptional regulator [Nocardioidaceae bacterium]